MGRPPTPLTKGSAIHVGVEPDRHAECCLKRSNNLRVRPAGLRSIRDRPVVWGLRVELDWAKAGNSNRTKGVPLGSLANETDAVWDRQIRSARVDPRPGNDVVRSSSDSDYELRAPTLNRTVDETHRRSPAKPIQTELLSTGPLRPTSPKPDQRTPCELQPGHSDRPMLLDYPRPRSD